MKRLGLNIIIWSIGIIAVCCGGKANAGVPGGSSLYPYVKIAIESAGTEKTSSSPIAVIPLDEDIYRQLDRGFGNLRVYAGMKNIPYAWRDRVQNWTEVMSYKPLSGQIIGFKYDRRKNQAIITYTIYPDKDEADNSPAFLARIQIHTSGKDFNKKISFYFDDGSKIENRPFFNYNKNVDLNGTEFVFPPVKTRTVKIIIDSFEENVPDTVTLVSRGADEKNNFTRQKIASRDLRIDGISAFSGKKVKVAGKMHKKEHRKLKETAHRRQDKQDIYEFDAGKLPICGFRLGNQESSYPREVKVECFSTASGSRKEKLLTSCRGNAGNNEKVLLIPECRPDMIRVSIYNGDDEPLKKPEFIFLSVEKELVLEKRSLPDGEIKIYYGGKPSAPPEYSICKYIHRFDGDNGSVYELSAQQNNPEWKKTLNYAGALRKTMPFVIAAAALILIFIIYRMYSRE